jgi:hypothetical protein
MCRRLAYSGSPPPLDDPFTRVNGVAGDWLRPVGRGRSDR